MNIVLPRVGTSALQRKLYLKAKQEEGKRFYTLYDKIYRLDVLHRAYDLVRENGGSPGLDGQTFERIERTEEGRMDFVNQLREELVTKTYQAQAVKRVYIPKGNRDEKRPLGIPTIRDRVVQMAAKLVLEPIFEADFSDHSFGYRPKRHAHQAMDQITKAMRQGHVNVIDADLSKFFDTLPHDKLLLTVAERISDGEVKAMVKSSRY
jgi:group II intron reverse transcriptase/maturase